MAEGRRWSRGGAVVIVGGMVGGRGMGERRERESDEGLKVAY